jgi:2-dehydropantoate 2-reductase
VRFIVYGAGAVGGVMGARLFQAGHDVTLIARGAHYEAIRDHGLRVESPEDAATLRIPVVTTPAEANPASGDVVLLAMKTQDTAPALDELSAVAPPDIAVVCVQNGVENERLALRRFPEVYGICVMLPGTHTEPGVVRAHRAPVTGTLDVGRYPGGVDGTAEAIAAALTSATFRSQARADVMRYKYGKLLNNLGNAVEVVIRGGRHGDDVTRLAREEGVAAMRAAGIDPAEIVFTGDLRPAGGRPHLGGSTYQSLHRRTGTVEVDYLNGEVVLLGREHGVPTPVNELLRRLANRMARERIAPGLMTREEFLAALEAECATPGDAARARVEAP